VGGVSGGVAGGCQRDADGRSATGHSCPRRTAEPTLAAGLAGRLVVVVAAHHIAHHATIELGRRLEEGEGLRLHHLGLDGRTHGLDGGAREGKSGGSEREHYEAICRV